MDKYLSIITNFGCHYTCPYCIVKNNNIDVPHTTIAGLDSLQAAIQEHECNIVSVSGGGDPLFDYKHNRDWYKKLFALLNDIDVPLEMHTSYIQSEFPVEKCKRVVYHLRNKNQLNHIKRYGKEIVRVVFVVTDDMTEDDITYITEFVQNSSDIDELSFKQMVRQNYEISYHLHDFLKAGHKVGWYYIEQNDYNLYYAENQIYRNYNDFQVQGN